MLLRAGSQAWGACGFLLAELARVHLCLVGTMGDCTSYRPLIGTDGESRTDKSKGVCTSHDQFQSRGAGFGPLSEGLGCKAHARR